MGAYLCVFWYVMMGVCVFVLSVFKCVFVFVCVYRTVV